MSSNIKINRICEYCGKQFVARTTTTRYCPKVEGSGKTSCGALAYKARSRKNKINKSNVETSAKIIKPIEELKAKEFLTVKQAAKLLNLSLRTTYRLIEVGTIKAINLAQRKITIRRSDIDKLFEQPPQPNEKASYPAKEYDISECYSIGEISIKFDISDKAVYAFINRNNIPKKQKGKFVYVPKHFFDEVFTPLNN